MSIMLVSWRKILQSVYSCNDYPQAFLSYRWMPYELKERIVSNGYVLELIFS